MSSLHIVLDWRPFEYSTHDSSLWGIKFGDKVTRRFEPLANGGTRVYEIMKFELPLPRPFLRMFKKTFTKLFAKREEEMLQTAARLAEEDYAKSKRDSQ